MNFYLSSDKQQGKVTEQNLTIVGLNKVKLTKDGYELDTSLH